MPYYVYVLYQENKKTFYVGFTSDLKRRILEHKRNSVESTRSTKNSPKLIFYEVFFCKKDAQRREKYFKTTKGKRSLKLMLTGARSKLYK